MAKHLYIIAFIIAAVLGYVFFSFRNTTTGPIQSHRSYQLEIISGDENVQPNKSTALVYRIKNERGEVLKDFATVHEKIMHFIVVRKDLQEFQHLHPVFSPASGKFSVSVVLPTDGQYRIFPDFTPAQEADNPQLLPVTLSHDIMVGNADNYRPEPVIADKETSKTIGDYRITLTKQEELLAQTPTTYSLNIKKNGKDVTDLQLYLGALGHSVIFRADTLDFIHAHAESGMMNMSGMDHSNMEMDMMESSGPDVSFSAVFPQAGLYKIFVQFQHEGRVFTIDFVVNVK